MVQTKWNNNNNIESEYITNINLPSLCLIFFLLLCIKKYKKTGMVIWLYIIFLPPGFIIIFSLCVGSFHHSSCFLLFFCHYIKVLSMFVFSWNVTEFFLHIKPNKHTSLCSMYNSIHSYFLCHFGSPSGLVSHLNSLALGDRSPSLSNWIVKGRDANIQEIKTAPLVCDQFILL